jgi:hypothetical protein
MDRRRLVAEAVEAGRIASHNLKVIQGNPDAVKYGEYDSIQNYLMMVIRVAEIEKARLAGRTSLRTRLKYLVAFILRENRTKGKRGAA